MNEQTLLETFATGVKRACAERAVPFSADVLQLAVKRAYFEPAELLALPAGGAAVGALANYLGSDPEDAQGRKRPWWRRAVPGALIGGGLGAGAAAQLAATSDDTRDTIGNLGGRLGGDLRDIRSLLRDMTHDQRTSRYDLSALRDKLAPR